MTSPTSGTYTLLPARGSCPSGKVQYANRKQAKRFRRKRGGGPVGTYQCDDCGFWHMGHMPRRVRTGRVSKAEWLRTRGK